MTTVIFLVVCMASLSILVGHGTFYKLNRENFFNQRTLAIQRQRIQHLARYDQLTGLTERHVFEKNLRQEVAYADRHAQSLTLLIIDLDHFKAINDTYGHQGGDAVLERIGDFLSSGKAGLLREEDRSYRFGGEEFCVLLRETGLSTTRTIAERIRTTLAEETFVGEEGEEFQVTCSIGLASYDERMKDSEGLIRQADEKLYEAKELGRDRIVDGR